jgi:hypothetical protein
LAGTCSITDAAEVWEYDGADWQRIVSNGFGDANNTAVFSMLTAENHLFAGTWNLATGAEIWENDGSEWTQINQDGFDDVNNIAVFSMIIFDGALYAGTWNRESGTEIWKYDKDEWYQLNNDGFGDANNVNALSMIAFEEQLYVGTENVTTGGEVWKTDFDPSHGAGPSDNSCFIATAAYGSDMTDDVIALKHFRDTVLLPSSLGRDLVRCYYAISPPVAAFIEEHELLRIATRYALIPLVYGVRYPKTSAFLVSLFSIVGILLTLKIRRSTRS